MAKLSAARRNRLPDSAFAYPSVRKYPIHDAAHRKAAVREASKSSTYGTQRHVKKRINQRLGKKPKTQRKRKR